MKSVDYLELPDRVDNIIYVEMSDKERKLYEELEKEQILLSLEELETDGIVVAQSAAALIQKLLQFSNGAAYTDELGVREFHDRKLTALEDIIEEANGQPILIFYSFKHDLDRIQKKFGKDVYTLDDDNAISRWNAGEITILCAHPASAGHGLNLQDGGHIIVWFGLTWSLELYQQANARLHRQGQKNTTIIHHILTSDTQDDRVYQVLQGKEKSQDELLDALKAKIKEVTNNESEL